MPRNTNSGHKKKSHNGAQSNNQYSPPFVPSVASANAAASASKPPSSDASAKPTANKDSKWNQSNLQNVNNRTATSATTTTSSSAITTATAASTNHTNTSTKSLTKTMANVQTISTVLSPTNSTNPMANLHPAVIVAAKFEQQQVKKIPPNFNTAASISTSTMAHSTTITSRGAMTSAASATSAAASLPQQKSLGADTKQLADKPKGKIELNSLLSLEAKLLKDIQAYDCDCLVCARNVTEILSVKGKDTAKLLELSCGHSFCNSCIENPSIFCCPVCRKEILEGYTKIRKSCTEVLEDENSEEEDIKNAEENLRSADNNLKSAKNNLATNIELQNALELISRIKTRLTVENTIKGSSLSSGLNSQGSASNKKDLPIKSSSLQMGPNTPSHISSHLAVEVNHEAMENLTRHYLESQEKLGRIENALATAKAEQQITKDALTAMNMGMEAAREQFRQSRALHKETNKTQEILLKNLEKENKDLREELNALKAVQESKATSISSKQTAASSATAGAATSHSTLVDPKVTKDKSAKKKYSKKETLAELSQAQREIKKLQEELKQKEEQLLKLQQTAVVAPPPPASSASTVSTVTLSSLLPLSVVDQASLKSWNALQMYGGTAAALENPDKKTFVENLAKELIAQLNPWEWEFPIRVVWSDKSFSPDEELIQLLHAALKEKKHIVEKRKCDLNLFCLEILPSTELTLFELKRWVHIEIVNYKKVAFKFLSRIEEQKTLIEFNKAKSLLRKFFDFSRGYSNSLLAGILLELETPASMIVSEALRDLRVLLSAFLVDDFQTAFKGSDHQIVAAWINYCKALIWLTDSAQLYDMEYIKGLLLKPLVEVKKYLEPIIKQRSLYFNSKLKPFDVVIKGNLVFIQCESLAIKRRLWLAERNYSETAMNVILQGSSHPDENFTGIYCIKEKNGALSEVFGRGKRAAMWKQFQFDPVPLSKLLPQIPKPSPSSTGTAGTVTTSRTATSTGANLAALTAANATASTAAETQSLVKVESEVIVDLTEKSTDAAITLSNDSASASENNRLFSNSTEKHRLLRDVLVSIKTLIISKDVDGMTKAIVSSTDKVWTSDFYDQSASKVLDILRNANEQELKDGISIFFPFVVAVSKEGKWMLYEIAKKISCDPFISKHEVMMHLCDIRHKPAECCQLTLAKASDNTSPKWTGPIFYLHLTTEGSYKTTRLEPGLNPASLSTQAAAATSNQSAHSASAITSTIVSAITSTGVTSINSAETSPDKKIFAKLLVQNLIAQFEPSTWQYPIEIEFTWYKSNSLYPNTEIKTLVAAELTEQGKKDVFVEWQMCNPDKVNCLFIFPPNTQRWEDSNTTQINIINYKTAEFKFKNKLDFAPLKAKDVPAFMKELFEYSRDLPTDPFISGALFKFDLPLSDEAWRYLMDDKNWCSAFIINDVRNAFSNDSDPEKFKKLSRYCYGLQRLNAGMVKSVFDSSSALESIYVQIEKERKSLNENIKQWDIVIHHNLLFIQIEHYAIERRARERRARTALERYQYSNSGMEKILENNGNLDGRVTFFQVGFDKEPALIIDTGVQAEIWEKFTFDPKLLKQPISIKSHLSDSQNHGSAATATAVSPWEIVNNKDTVTKHQANDDDARKIIDEIRVRPAQWVIDEAHFEKMIRIVVEHINAFTDSEDGKNGIMIFFPTDFELKFGLSQITMCLDAQKFTHCATRPIMSLEATTFSSRPQVITIQDRERALLSNDPLRNDALKVVLKYNETAKLFDYIFLKPKLPLSVVRAQKSSAAITNTTAETAIASSAALAFINPAASVTTSTTAASAITSIGAPVIPAFQSSISATSPINSNATSESTIVSAPTPTEPSKPASSTSISNKS